MKVSLVWGFCRSVFACAALLTIASSAQAASLYIDPPFSSLNRGDQATLAVRIDTDEAQGECVNAVDAVITYPENIDATDVSIGKSIFPIWVEQPVINRENRTITFAGGIPNGYCGRVEGDPRLTNILAEIIFRSPGFTVGGGSAGTNAEIGFSPETTAYLNDGQGTRAELRTFGASIELSTRAGSMIINPWQDAVAADIIPPESFSILLQQDESAFANKYFIVFNTTDKQTGIDQYQVMEEPLTQFGAFQWGRADAPWLTARSPYVLRDQSLNSIIRVRALDKAGNEYIATYIPEDSIRKLSQLQILMGAGIVAVGLMFAVIAMTLYIQIRRWNLRRRNKMTRLATSADQKTDEIAE